MLNGLPIHLPAISNSVSVGPNKWYTSKKTIPRHIPDAHVQLWGKVSHTVQIDGTLGLQPEPAIGVSKNSLSRSQEETNTTSRLIRAAATGEILCLKDMIESGMDKNSKDADGLTVTMHACRSGHADVVAYLLNLKVDLGPIASPIGGAKTTALILASENGHSTIVDQLLLAGSPVDFAPWSGHTPLLMACKEGHTTTVRCLIRHHADRSKKDVFGNTTVHMAAIGGHANVLREIFAIGDEARSSPPPNVDVYDQKGVTPLLWTAIYGHDESCKLLLQLGATVGLVHRMEKWTPLMYAIKFGNHRVVKILLQFGAVYKCFVPGKSLLFLYACSIGDVKTIDALVKVGCDVNMKNGIGLSALVVAATRCNSAACQYLLRHGANPNERDTKEHWTPVKWAAKFGDYKTIECLLDLGVDVHVRDPGETTALMLAAAGGHVDAAKVLLSPQADPRVNAQNQLGWTAFMLAVNSNHISMAKCLLQHGADIDLQSLDGCTALHRAAREGYVEMVRYLLLNKVNTKKRGADKSIAAFQACAHGHYEILKMLVRNRPVCVREKDENKWTLLHLACHQGHEKIVDFLLTQQKMLVLDARTSYGQNALHLACRWSRSKHIVAALIEQGAEMESKDYGEYGRATPLLFAAMGGNAQIVGHLLREGADFLYKNVIGKNAQDIATEHGHVTAGTVLAHYIKNWEIQKASAEAERVRLENERLEQQRLRVEAEMAEVRRREMEQRKEDEMRRQKAEAEAIEREKELLRRRKLKLKQKKKKKSGGNKKSAGKKSAAKKMMKGVSKVKLGLKLGVKKMKKK